MTRVKKEAPAGDPKTAPMNATAELGSTGLKRFGGYIYEEFLTELKGIRGIRTYREMSDNDPIITAMLFAIEMLMRGVPWSVQPFSSEPEDQVQAAFVESALDDMEQPWAETIAEILSMLKYGFSYHEVVYKYRRGENPFDPTQDSKYNDGLLGWRKMPIRSQDSLLRWKFNDVGDLLAMEQLAPPTYRLTELPVTKCLLFRTTTHKADPQGRSILRGAYRPWFMKKHIENIEAIGIERDLAGMPIFWLPPHLLSEDATPDDKLVVAEYKRIITNIKRDEQEGVVMPLSYDEQGHKLYDFTLLSSGSRRQFDTTGIITRYNQQILMTCLADVILIGHEKVGSLALHSSKTELFATAIGAWLGTIADVMNRTEIPRLLRLNAMRTDRKPKLVPGDIETVDLKDLAAYVTALAGAGAQLFPDAELEAYLKRQAGMPVSASPEEQRTTPTGAPPRPATRGTPDPTIEKPAVDPTKPAPDRQGQPPDPNASVAGKV